MPTSMMIGVAVFVVAVLVVVAVVYSDNNVEGEVVIDNEVNIEEEEQPKCETHTCPEGYDLDDEGFGDTDAECCWPPYCDDSIVCDGNEVVQEGTRGLTKESCCQLPLCTDKVGGICNAEDKRLKNSDVRGVSDDECCDTLPTCGSHVCGPGYKRADDAAERYGNTDGECCVLKTCGENNWDNNDGRKCTIKGMKWDAGNIDIAGNSEDICCAPANCYENEFTNEKCSDPRRGGEYGLTALMPDATSPEEMGKTHAECCATSKCSEPEPIISCNEANGRTMKVPEPYATTEAECCEDIKCSVYFDEYKRDNGGTTGCPPNMKPKGADTSGTTQEECCTVKTCSDVDGDTCGSGKALKGSDPLPETYPDSFNFDITCCTDMTCDHPDSPYKTEEGCNEGNLDADLDASVRDVQVDSYALYKPKSDLPGVTATRAACCENKLCSQLTNLNCDQIGKKLNPAARQWTTGEDCCMNKTCADIESGRTCDAGTKKKSNLGDIDVTPGSNDDADLDTAFQGTCCSSKTCADLDVDCASIEVNGQTNVMEKDESKDALPLSGSECCKWKTCTANGWTDAICKDRTKVRAKYRGSLKSDTATGPPPTDRDQPDGADGQPQSVPNAPAETGGGWSVGDSRCCEQDDDNFARQCVSKEYHNGTYKRKSGGVHTSRHMGPVLGAETTGQDANSCMQKCKQNNDCTTFSIDRNGKCVLRAGGSQSTTGNDRKHGGSTLRGVVGIELGGGASAAGGKTRASQYVSMDTFKGWPDMGGSHIGSHPHMTGKPTQSAIDLTRSGTGSNTKGVTKGNFSNRTGNLTTEDDSKTWVGRENVLLAGVDEEFCPYDFFQAYDHSSSAHAQPGSDAPTVPQDIGLTSASRAAAGNKCHEMAYQGYHTAPNAHSLTTQEGLNSCYSDPDCAAVWVNTSGANPWSNGQDPNILKHRREDVTSSRMGISAGRNTMESNHHRWTRRMCYKHHLSTQSHVTNPAANKHPGAFLVKTRYKDTRDNKKYIGRAPDKPTFSSPFPVESKLLISGDTAV